MTQQIGATIAFFMMSVPTSSFAAKLEPNEVAVLCHSLSAIWEAQLPGAPYLGQGDAKLPSKRIRPNKNYEPGAEFVTECKKQKDTSAIEDLVTELDLHCKEVAKGMPNGGNERRANCNVRAERSTGALLGFRAMMRTTTCGGSGNPLPATDNGTAGSATADR